MLIADLHIHSKYSRATSRDCDLPHLDLWARNKGLGLIGTGDFTHPGWRKELADMLLPAEEGVFLLKDEYQLPCAVASLPGAEPPPASPRFVLSGEISTIYKKNGKTRKVHHVILLPSLDAAETLSHKLEAIGNLHSDGRPILGLDSRDLLEITLDTCPQAIYIPAHIWTPHFSLFGAFSGFDTLEECYEDLTPHVRALETGLSSDPAMNHRISMLDGFTLVSNSDAHSPAKLGREANLLSITPSYGALQKALETGEGFEGTLEFFPEEGKYHLDGHRACDVRLEPEETEKFGDRCPACGHKITIGVLHRVEELADRAIGVPSPASKPFEHLIPLPEVIAASIGASTASQKTQACYTALLQKLGPELIILRETPLDSIEAVAGPAIAEGVRRLRQGLVNCLGGYDGEYGTIALFAPDELEVMSGQLSLLGVDTVKKRKAKASGLVTPKRASPAKPHDNSQNEPIPADPLNLEQAQAVASKVPFLAVIAGPGTGKTKTLVERIAFLVEQEGVSPSCITAVTFTNQAAAEMRQRLEMRLGGKKQLRGLTVGTFHAICLQLLDQKPIVSAEEQRQIVQELLPEYGMMELAPGDFLRQVTEIKNGKSPAGAGLPEALFHAYQNRLRQLGVRDLDDLLLDALQLDTARQKRFAYLLVDEFQDISPVQHRLITHWARANLFVIGDPDQSIYGFRGADARCFASLQASYPTLETITLKQNYRSSPQVLGCALALINENPGSPRRLNAHRPEGAPVRITVAQKPFDEAAWVAAEIRHMVGGVDMQGAGKEERSRNVLRSFSDIAVLCRTRRQLSLYESCLRRESIPCTLYGRDDFLSDTHVLGTLGFFGALLEPMNLSALDTCLRLYYRIPGPLVQQILAHRAHESENPSGFSWSDAFPHPVLAPWLADWEAFAPMARKEKPRKLLQAWVDAHGKNAALEQLLHASVFHETMPGFLEALRLGEEADIRRSSTQAYHADSVKLMTVHGSKGLEFPVVFLSADAFPRANASTDQEKIPEERRLFFVGMTRAKEELIITTADQGPLFLPSFKNFSIFGKIKERKTPQKMEQTRLF